MMLLLVWIEECQPASPLSIVIVLMHSGACAEMLLMLVWIQMCGWASGCLDQEEPFALSFSLLSRTVQVLVVHVITKEIRR
jgi:hypothetical protein